MLRKPYKFSFDFPFNPSPEAILQMLHVFIGFTIALGSVHWLHVRPSLSGWCVLLFAVPKEMCWDMWQEPTTWFEEVWDLIWYTAGGLAMSLILFFTG